MESDDRILKALFKYTEALSVALAYRDLMTRLHSQRVRDLSLIIGARYGLSDRELRQLMVSSSFHDIGKIGIPDKVLLKRDKLDDEEWEIMKRHSEFGEKIMLSTGLEGAEETSLVIRHHHEHYNGSGYPDGLSGQSIPIFSRIISIADSYDAMAITRAYRKARRHQEIMEVMHGETGIKFEPQLMDIFCEVIEQSPYKAE